MSNPPKLTDRLALTRNRHRATSSGFTDFLHRTVADEVQERRKEVNRVFTDVAVVSGFPEFWKETLPDARQIEDQAQLELPEEGFDLVLHMLALHWADDPVGQLVQARRALRPDGMVLACLPGGETLWELRQALAKAEAQVTGGLSPRIAPMAEIRDLGGLMQRAGFALPVADTVPLTVTYESPLHLMRELRAMGEANALHARLRKPTARQVLLKAAEIYTTSHGENGRIPATVELIFLTGWAPDPSQPKPLRPGSATHNLADALSQIPDLNTDKD